MNENNSIINRNKETIIAYENAKNDLEKKIADLDIEIKVLQEDLVEKIQ